MFEKLLYPTDFSDVSKKALEYIEQLKKFGAKTVVVLHVIDERTAWSAVGAGDDAGAVGVADLQAKMEQGAENEMRVTEAKLKESGFNVKVRIERGIPFREILRVEEEEDVSAVVIGSHGKSMVEEMLLGSVSEQVIRKSKKLLLVVRR